jgi:haloacid dehalogenase-like hydrolase
VTLSIILEIGFICIAFVGGYLWKGPRSQSVNPAKLARYRWATLFSAGWALIILMKLLTHTYKWGGVGTEDMREAKNLPQQASNCIVWFIFAWVVLYLVEEWCTQNGYSMSRVAAIGDSRSDVPLFRRVGMSIALNATPDARSVATHVHDTENLRDVLALLQPAREVV